MAVPCTSCGEPVSDTDVRCPACDALAPLDTTGTPPWSIPLREPAVPVAEPVADVVEPRRIVTVGVITIAVVAALVVVAGQLIGGGGGSDDVAGGTGPAASSPDERTDLASSEADAAPSTSAASSTTTSTTSTTTPTSTTTTTTTTTAPAPSAGSVPELSSSFRGWVAQLTSVPTSAGTDSLESAWAEARAHAGDAVATRSDRWASMAPGYWVIVAPGPFDSEEAVRNFCASVGRGGDGCLPRMLSDRR